jgi:hypothetical protein
MVSVMQDAHISSPEDSKERFARLASVANTRPQRVKCDGITRKGERCTAWAVTGQEKCAGHLKLVPLDSKTGVQARQRRAEERKRARLSVRDRVGEALEENVEEVIAALKDGIRLADRKAAAKAAGDWIALVYGRQLQKPEDEKPSEDPLDVASMTREERDRLKRKLLAQHPELAQQLRLASSS